MDISKMLQDLYEEKKKLEQVIQSLEELSRYEGVTRTGVPRAGRGRKSMGPEERLEVSARMKKYWESRRRRKS